ncbi:uncharacterized protein LOC129599346 [Paramacrobiotus metropolitanus]|uniref:uncharacterized protein LOC129599346 n=1 Tax=Paramacrobiotus metropolitanus TaxID=2943436 RepID=UPI0024463331|nr:uncharacterized protein LOC129599346 [Paramacrobiotus metropolitanus]
MASSKPSVQFSSAPPEIIRSRHDLRRRGGNMEGKGNSVGPAAAHGENYDGLSAENRTVRRKRLVKLLIIFAIPVIAVFTQCGIFLDRMLSVNELAVKTNATIHFLLGMELVINCVQHQREISSLLALNHSCASPSLKQILPLPTAENSPVINLTACLQILDVEPYWKFPTGTNYHMLNTSYRDVLIWYTDEILGQLFRLIDRRVHLHNDNNGTMWDYVVAYELFMRVRDNLEIQRTLSTAFLITGSARQSDLKWFIENGSICEILLNISEHYLNASRLYPQLFLRFREAHHRWHNAKQNLLDENKNRLNGSGGGGLTAEAEFFRAVVLELQTSVEDFLSTTTVLQHSIGDELKGLSSLQRHQADVDRLFGIGLLIFSAIVCPLLAIWYLHSVNDLSILIETYASSMTQKAAELTFEQRKTEHLLYQMLPPTVADALKHNVAVPTEVFENVTVFFSVVANFESFTNICDPLQVVDFLNTLYLMMDTEIDRFDVYKVETIGDEYMVASGLPARNGDKHASEVADLSLRVMEAVEQLLLPDNDADIKKISLRIGLHSGTCVAGVVGLKMPRYCLFGDTVNTASRMESNGKDGQIHLSVATKECLDVFDAYVLLRRGTISVKGKGSMETFWLLGKKGMNFTIIPPDPD